MNYNLNMIGQKVFTKKQKYVGDNEGNLLLMSYTTIVAKITDPILTGEKKAIIHGWYSNTTARHINEFLQQHGFKKLSKKDMEGGAELW